MNNDIIKALTNYGYLDIDRCNNLMDEAGVLDNDVAEYIREFTEDTDGEIDAVDIVASAYDYILQQVRTEISNAIGKDIENDLDENVHTHGNYRAITKYL